jgi:hypothetical protein
MGRRDYERTGEPKWTKGPWGIAQYENYVGFSIWAAGVGCIAERWWPAEEKNVPIEANAHLIAAAPELYEALKLAAAFFESGYTVLAGSGQVSAVVKIGGMGAVCNIALAKARGESDAR